MLGKFDCSESLQGIATQPNKIMTKEKTSYGIPVFELGGENDAVAQSTVNEADENILVKIDDRQYGKPDLRVIHKQPNSRDVFQFRIRDETRRWCSYQDGPPDELPVNIQQAVTAFGYGICDLGQKHRYLFDLLEATRLYDRHIAVEADYEGLPVLQQLIRDTRQDLFEYKVLLLAKSELSDTMYWNVFDEVDDFYHRDNYGLSFELIQSLVAELPRQTKTRMLYEGASDFLEEATVLLSDAEADGEESLMAHFVNDRVAARFEFRRTGSDRCVLNKPTGIQPPPAVITELRDRGYTVTNVNSVARAQDEIQLVNRVERFCTRLSQADLLPDDIQPDGPGPFVNTALNTASVLAFLKLFSRNPRQARQLHRMLCNNYGIRTVQDMTTEDLYTMSGEFSHALPDELLAELKSKVAKLAPEAFSQTVG